jgi:ABC-type sugar transport system permease subunit
MTVLRSKRIWTAVFLAVPLILYVVIVVVPLLTSFYFSLTDWNGFSRTYNFIEFANFQKIRTDPLFLNAIQNTIVWMIAAVVIPTTLGLAIALVLNQGMRFSNFFKSLFYLPICLSLAVIGQVWIWIYHPDWGLLNLMLDFFKIEAVTRAWLSNPDTALTSVIAAWSWQQIGLAMVIFLAGLTAIPSELTEAAKIDGADYWQGLRFVIVPLLAPATVVVVALAIINSLKSFDIVYIMTGGGPFHSSDTLAMFMYTESFKKYYMGYGSAIAVVLFIIALVVIALYFRQVRALERLYD